MSGITSHGFDEHIRKRLRNSGHDFTPEKLNRARNIFDHALVASRHTALKREHFDDALRRMEGHAEWKRLTEGQRDAFVSTMRNHLKIKEPPAND